MYKVAILDDEKNFLEEIHNCLQEYEMFEVSYFQEAKLLIDEIDYFDVVYIDYEMENMIAFEFFKETQMSKYIRIIITKYDHIVYKSIDYDIFDFIRKKKLKEDIHNKMNRLLKKLESDHDRIIVESGNRIVAIYYDDIQYIHTDKNYIVIHGREEYKIRSTFKDFIKKIKKNDFITISYGILVNMRYVQYINLKEMMVVFAISLSGMAEGMVVVILILFKGNITGNVLLYSLIAKIVFWGCIRVLTILYRGKIETSQKKSYLIILSMTVIGNIMLLVGT